MSWMLASALRDTKGMTGDKRSREVLCLSTYENVHKMCWSLYLTVLTGDCPPQREHSVTGWIDDSSCGCQPAPPFGCSGVNKVGP